ncbi:hypothetical protein GCM10010358_43390 [Streptomyces minutiscleroticus]|uniref:Uncharacterized protein n=1 Tax=Streptomyces minutiscleroticus TaxID=68238 RepID=A0A918NPF8_9ACTN|nr:hypothetical protein GCM10010358_43390 [Streptomyces minutiscleroticus]
MFRSVVRVWLIGYASVDGDCSPVRVLAAHDSTNPALFTTAIFCTQGAAWAGAAWAATAGTVASATVPTSGSAVRVNTRFIVHLLRSVGELLASAMHDPGARADIRNHCGLRAATRTGRERAPAARTPSPSVPRPLPKARCEGR